MPDGKHGSGTGDHESGGKDRAVTSFDPVGEFFKPFVTGPNRILIFTEEDRDETGREAMAKPQGEEGTSATVAIVESGIGSGPCKRRRDRCGQRCALRGRETGS